MAASPEYSSLEIFMGRMTAVGLRRLRMGLATLTYQDWLLSCFVLGVLAGTAAALAFGGPVVQGCVLGAAGTAGTVRAGGRYAVKDFLAVWKQRAFEAGAGWLAGLTVCSQMLFGFLTFYAGMSLAVVLSVWTMRKGILGIAAFLCSILPHGIIYLLIWYVLSVWSGQAQKKLHILPGLLLIAMSGAGAFLEIWISPLLAGLF